MKIRFPIFYLSLLSILCLIVTSCNDDAENLDATILTVDTNSVIDEEEVQSIFESIEELGNDALTEALDGSTGGKYNGTFASCAVINLDIVSQSVTIDFGEGCEGPRGRIRSGKIIITYSARHFDLGAVVTTTFENFVVDGLKIEGTRTVTNLANSIDENPKFNVKIEGGKVTWPDGTSATREVNRTKTWVRSDSPLTDEFHIEGIAEGVTRAGKAYKSTIVENVIFKVLCAEQKIFIPAKGIKDIEVDGSLKVTVDYGDGTCDNIITITKGENSIEVDVTDGRQG